jgi:predicted transcriptional regulator
MKTTTVRIDENILERLDSLAENLSRPRSWVINQAIERFIEYEEWFVREVKAGLQEVEQGKVATDKEVSEAFGKWGVDAR